MESDPHSLTNLAGEKAPQDALKKLRRGLHDLQLPGYRSSYAASRFTRRATSLA